MRILITGGTGLIGSHLVPVLEVNHEIVVITRNVSMAERELGHKVEFHSSMDHFSDLNDIDAVINLAGETIVNKRWTETQKGVIESSRWDTTAQLVKLIKNSEQPPSVFLSGSAIGYYGRQDASPVDEYSDKFHDEFSHQLCKKWEDIAQQAESDKTRVCLLRTGIVLAKNGGALGKMLLPFKLGLGGPIASGNQYMSWIHIQDMVTAIELLLENEGCRGVYNFTAPEPVTNRVFSQTLAKALGKPCIFKTPAFVLQLMMGEMSDLLLHGQNVVPTRLKEAGFTFDYAELKSALHSLHLRT